LNEVLPKIIKAGVIVGTLDILTACTYYFFKTGNNPLNILKYIASRIFGEKASAGGNTMIVLGLILHYVIAFAFTTFFFWLFPRIGGFSKSKIGTGIIYGIFVWAVMNLVVVPLSNIPGRPFNLVNSVINAVILIVCIGIPLSFMATEFYEKASAGKKG
jgi:hypothetical protein